MPIPGRTGPSVAFTAFPESQEELLIVLENFLRNPSAGLIAGDGEDPIPIPQIGEASMFPFAQQMTLFHYASREHPVRFRTRQFEYGQKLVSLKQ